MLMRNRNNSSKHMASQEQQTFFSVVLNLQSHIHDTADFQKYRCVEAGGQFMLHSACPRLTTSSNAGSQHASRKAGKHDGLLCGQKALTCYRILHLGGVDILTASMSISLKFLSDPAEIEKGEKKVLAFSVTAKTVFHKHY